MANAAQAPLEPRLSAVENELKFREVPNTGAKARWQKR
jgi:hypothetical protein